MSTLPFTLSAGRKLFLDYRGRLRLLPTDWQVWNATDTSGALVGTLTCSDRAASTLAHDDVDYDGPFFHTGQPSSRLDPEAPVRVLECVFIRPAFRGGPLWDRYTELLASAGRPVYASFANARLGERFARLYTPATADAN